MNLTLITQWLLHYSGSITQWYNPITQWYLMSDDDSVVQYICLFPLKNTRVRSDPVIMKQCRFCCVCESLYEWSFTFVLLSKFTTVQNLSSQFWIFVTKFRFSPVLLLPFFSGSGSKYLPPVESLNCLQIIFCIFFLIYSFFVSKQFYCMFPKGSFMD